MEIMRYDKEHKYVFEQIVWKPNILQHANATIDDSFSFLKNDLFFSRGFLPFITFFNDSCGFCKLDVQISQGTDRFADTHVTTG